MAQKLPCPIHEEKKCASSTHNLSPSLGKGGVGVDGFDERLCDSVNACVCVCVFLGGVMRGQWQPLTVSWPADRRTDLTA